MTSARDLSARLAELLHRERAALAAFLVALADFDRKRLWLELGHASLFYFLHRELGLSSGAAFYRKTAAGLIQRFPDIVDPLRDGRLCMTSVVELAKVLTPENRDDVLPRFFHLSKSGAKAVSAALRPAEAAPHRAVVTVARPKAPAPVLAAAAAGHPVLESPFRLDETLVPTRSRSPLRPSRRSGRDGSFPRGRLACSAPFDAPSPRRSGSCAPWISLAPAERSQLRSVDLPRPRAA